MVRSESRASCWAMAVLCCWSAIGAAQAGRVYTAADYAQAEKFMDYNVNPLVYHTVKDPVWLDDGRFWYRDSGTGRHDLHAGRSGEADQGSGVRSGKVAAALNAASPVPKARRLRFCRWSLDICRSTT